MTHSASDLSTLIAEVLAAWHGIELPEAVAARAGADFERLIATLRAMPPVPFDLQAHHFAPLLEALADD